MTTEHIFTKMDLIFASHYEYRFSTLESKTQPEIHEKDNVVHVFMFRNAYLLIIYYYYFDELIKSKLKKK